MPVDTPERCKSLHGNDFASEPREIFVPAGLGHFPLHVTEHGWPTGEGRTPARQARFCAT